MDGLPNFTALEPLDLVERALQDLQEELSFEEIEGAPTHTVISASGLESPSSTAAFGMYLVGALAGAVRHDAQLCADMLPSGIDGQQELTWAVTRLIGENNTFTSKPEISFRDTKRNAWIAEGVMHALLVVRARVENSLLSGPVNALAELHTIPTQQGLDAVAIYSEPSGPVVAIGESKASRLGGSAQLTEASQIFRDVDELKYGPELRSKLATLKMALPSEIAELVSNSLWLQHRCYFPMIVHELEFDLLAKRDALGRLLPSIERRRVIALRLKEFHDFFNSVADSMRSSVLKVVV
ncbi:hypothetical protein [Streptomyces sp. NRRL B-24484]|uniref:hypothetical protein n=1 Tax=Streptomyces sp. NRRL B-24484 TaxID=1463833 RepID=UPI0013317809|nr:hypothetical protein [Streptomyces sp. NRRL B-24484]